jgi:hypothetical protein
MKRAGKLTSDADVALFDRLAQHFERAAAELGEFVEEQDAVVREADFAGPRARAAADEGHVRGGVMRGAERAVHQQAAAGFRHASDGVDRGDVDGFVEAKRRQ